MSTLALLCLIGLAAPASAQRFLVVDWDGEVYEADVPSQTVTLVVDTGLVNVSGLDRRPDGNLHIYTVGGNEIRLLDPVTFD